MTSTHHHGLTVLPALISLLLLTSCASRPSPKQTSTAAPNPNNDPLATLFTPAPAKTGAQLWAENCTRCHYVRQNDYYGAAQWALVVQHMRSRANLTGDEARKITRFLQAGSGAD